MVNQTKITDIPFMISDDRGTNTVLYDDSIDFHVNQINMSYTDKVNTFRGLHFQKGENAQGKLVYCLSGKIYSVAVDLQSGCFYGGIVEPGKVMHIPVGYAHGFLTLTDQCIVQWCVDHPFDVKNSFSICMCDEHIRNEEGIILMDYLCDTFNVSMEDLILSDKDRNGMKFEELNQFQ